METKITLGHAIRSGRRELDFSQKDLAKQLQVDYCWLSQLENNRLEPSSDEVKEILPRLASIFQIEVEYLELLRSQTTKQELDLSKAMFPVYYREKLHV
ncbi:helix-turn-helix domain-containing protein [Laspinema olomoucense]|uniref:helix-turn-helix domain-containing protein n=1 Tax=Laspinema olomoucense TaxID=3231600 RepID=UPI0021BAAFF4|nr:helix-turn-helix transcriptional regulator [Laspinema sp. D3d]MCT7971278.1 helix-turn-helix domain-containing protein [Laspinema sp. D3d]